MIRDNVHISCFDCEGILIVHNNDYNKNASVDFTKRVVRDFYVTINNMVSFVFIHDYYNIS